MTRVALLSDTHGYLDDIILKNLADADEIWHAGDFGSVKVSETLSALKSLKGVYGNIDGTDIRKIHPLEMVFNCEGVKIYMTHIGGYPPNYTPQVKEKLYHIRPDLFICGHSHLLKVMRDKNLNNLLHINPGAAGKYGFHKVRTMVRFTIRDKKTENLEVIEMGPR